ncbi:exodeoxyribonuclease VII large subunit [Liquorilactobacillus capillatus]|uniref:Exodeoxyribonuclease 7 large subunit n=1 Tax=Liquorilactobacillus capillatus DSM 19910 TaxID=1423731 RepID=A0A0R1LZY6_9LACO|nr:exodeoxyribonuclease VII large subunit [Liquorilactobacillus capillatus]KRL01318.1 exodeoxyribonuclease VII large subunit [Liquorilactobacillus capillatus DSM 19910]
MSTEKYLTVSALTKYLKRKFDADPYLGRVYLTGEISNFRMRPRAHQYFSLKDEHAKISTIMFRSAFEKVKFRPEEGMKVLVVGRISLYEATGNYQIYVEKMEPDGVGALYQAYEQLKKKLSAEGLFSAPKKSLPLFPQRIAVITSPSGAVIKDIMTTVRRRYPIAQLVLFPTLVQGESAAADIVEKIQWVEQLSSFDTLIIGRGGGSIEDLWPFNEEIVARAIYDCQLPVISSVGHETDTTIADLVADVRAATPTAAAELAVPVLSDELLKINQLRVRLYQAFKADLKLKKQRLGKLRASYVFQQPQRLYEGYLQKLDYLAKRAERATQVIFTQNEHQLIRRQNRLREVAPLERVRLNARNVEYLKARLNKAGIDCLGQKRQQVQTAIVNLDMLSPLKIMTRGYSYIAQDEHVVKSVRQLTAGEKVAIHFIDGKATAEIKNIEENRTND